MRRSPITIGVLAAELAVGALVLAPPAAADDEPAVGPNPNGTPVVPEPSTPEIVEAPAVSVRTGRSGDPHAVTPVASSDVPAGDEAPDTPEVPTVPSVPVPASAPAPAPSEPPAAAGVPEAPAPTAAAPTPAASAPPAHTVVEGDNLWSIAAAHLASSTGREVGAIPVAEIALYWVRVCDANRATLRSGDLDVIYPGEVVTLPVL